MSSQNDPPTNDGVEPEPTPAAVEGSAGVEKQKQDQQGAEPTETFSDENLTEEVVERVDEYDESNENNKQVGNRCDFCMSDRSWTCIFLATVALGIIVGCILALIFTQHRVLEYFRPMPFVYPVKAFSIDYLWPGYRYDVYKEKQTLSNARKICEFYNTTLLIFNSTLEEKEIDCYMNVRNNAEDRQVIMWINESFVFGGPLLYVRLESFYSENRLEVIRKTTKVLEENGCDVQKNYYDKKSVWTADQENTQKETIYNMAKYYGNHGLRTVKQGNTNGCWNLIRWDEAAELKHSVMCRSHQPIAAAAASTAAAAAVENSLALMPSTQYNKIKLFSQVYCSDY